MSLRTTILEAQDIKTEPVEVPEWGVTVNVRSLDLGQRNDAISAARRDTDNLDLSVYYAHIIVYTVLDPETGEPIFTLNDVPLIQRKSPTACDRIAKQALAQSGLPEDPTKDEVDAAGEASSATQDGDSPS